MQWRQELLRGSPMLIEAGSHPLALGHHNRHPRGGGEEVAMPVNESPV